MKKKLIFALLAVFALVFIVTCDFGGGQVTYRYTVPQWLLDINNGTIYTETQDATREGALEGQRYFVGIHATENCIELIYNIKGKSGNADSDREVRYRQEDVPSMIDPSYSGSPISPDYGDYFYIMADTDVGIYAATLTIEKGRDISGPEAVYFDFRPNGNPAKDGSGEYGFRYLPMN